MGSRYCEVEPMSLYESDLDFYARIEAQKLAVSTIEPRGRYESDSDFSARLKSAKSIGKHELDADFSLRLEALQKRVRK